MPTKPNQGAGAGEALNRALQAERDLYDDYAAAKDGLAAARAALKTAMDNESHEEIAQWSKACKELQAQFKEAHAMWNTQSKTMLGLEKGVDQSKRIEGDTMSQYAVEEFAKMLLRFLRTGLENYLMSFCSEATQLEFRKFSTQELSEKLYEIGWDSPNDAQWSNLDKFLTESAADLTRPQAIYELCSPKIRETLANSVALAVKETRVPGWMIRIMEEELV